MIDLLFVVVKKELHARTEELFGNPAAYFMFLACDHAVVVVGVKRKRDRVEQRHAAAHRQAPCR